MLQVLQNLDISSLRPSEGLRMFDLEDADAGGGGDVNLLSRVLEKWLNESDLQFSRQTIALSSEELAAPDGLLPVLLHQARDCLARATGSAPRHAIVHQQSEDGLCGVAVSGVRTMGIGPWLLVTTFALEELATQHGKPKLVPLDDWYDRWMLARENEEVLVLNSRLNPEAQPQAQPQPSTRS